MNKQPLFILCISFVLGIFFQDYFQVNHVMVWVLIALALVLFALYYSKVVVLQKLRSLAPVGLALSVAMLFQLYNSKVPQLPNWQGKTDVVFSLDKKLNANDKNKKYIIRTDVGDESFLVLLSAPKELPDLDFKHVYSAKVYINKPDRVVNDFQFDYSRYLNRQGVYFQSYISGDYQVAAKKTMSFLEKLKQDRLELLLKIDDSNLNQETKSFLKGIVLADRTEMSDVLVQDFNRSGLMHFLAISGTHIVIIFGLISMVLQYIFSFKYRKYTVLLSVLLIWCFAMYIGMGNSVVRACIMISTYYGFVILQRKPDLLHSLSLAGLMILFVDSQQLFDVGFQLSFIAVLGIYWLNKPILSWLPKPKNWIQKLGVNTVSISLAAQLATFPLSIYYFHQFSFLSILANFIIVPLSEVVIVFSLLMVVFYKLNFISPIIQLVYQKLIDAVLAMIHWFGGQDFAFHQSIPMSLAEMLIVFLLIYFLRFLFVKFKIINFSLFLSVLIVFFVIRLSLDQIYQRKPEVLYVQYFHKVVVLKKSQDIVQVYVPEKVKVQIIENMIVKPYLSSRRIKRYEINIVKGDRLLVNGEEIKLTSN